MLQLQLNRNKVWQNTLSAVTIGIAGHNPFHSVPGIFHGFFHLEFR